jgi:hypothetical protein
VREAHPGDPQWTAFLMGVAGHGLGDQLFDAMYLYRGDEGQPDEATDIVIAALWGGHERNDHFEPYDALIPLFAAVGVSVDAETLRRGMTSLDLAVYYVGAAAEEPARVEAARAEAPWATAHLEDASVPGAPVCLGESLAAYWAVLERRLAGEAVDALVLSTFPADGALGWPREGRDAMLSVVFARAVLEATAEAEGVVSLDGPDGPVPVDAWMYYRDGSNVLNVLPREPLAADADYALTIAPGPVGIGGETLAAAVRVGFSTRPPPEPEPEAPAAARGCAHVGGGGPWGLLALAYFRPKRWSLLRSVVTGRSASAAAPSGPDSLPPARASSSAR